MYLSIMGKPTDEELLKYPSVHLTSIHEWDPSVLDYSHLEGDEEPLWACDPQHLDLLDPNFDAHGLSTKMGHQHIDIPSWCTTTLSHGHIIIQIIHSGL